MQYEKAMSNPAAVFSAPEEVENAPGLTTEQKVKVLRQWEYDAREKEVAEEENMGGGPDDLLSQILSVLDRLGASPGAASGPEGKQGGE